MEQRAGELDRVERARAGRARGDAPAQGLGQVALAAAVLVKEARDHAVACADGAAHFHIAGSAVVNVAAVEGAEPPTLPASPPQVPPEVVGGAALLGLMLLLTVSYAGHAASGRWVPVALVADVVHLAGVSAWLGGLTLLALVK